MVTEAADLHEAETVAIEADDLVQTVGVAREAQLQVQGFVVDHEPQ